jgi:hypothetical protein
MFCPTCGNALSQQLKYCNRCGANLATSDAMEAVEKRLNAYLDGLFWLTILGLGFIIGGMILMKKFQFSETFIAVFMVLSSAAFVVNFAINLREVQRLKRAAREGITQIEGRPTSELSLPPAHETLSALSSVTENTTRSLEEIQTPISEVKQHGRSAATLPNNPTG